MPDTRQPFSPKPLVLGQSPKRGVPAPVRFRSAGLAVGRAPSRPALFDPATADFAWSAHAGVPTTSQDHAAPPSQRAASKAREHPAPVILRVAHAAIITCRSGTPKVRRKFAAKGPSGRIASGRSSPHARPSRWRRVVANPTRAVWARRGRTSAILADAGRVWAAAAAGGDFAPFFTKSKPGKRSRAEGDDCIRPTRCLRRGGPLPIWCPPAANLVGPEVGSDSTPFSATEGQQENE